MIGVEDVEGDIVGGESLKEEELIEIWEKYRNI